jgi:hypothetical protein
VCIRRYDNDDGSIIAQFLTFEESVTLFYQY